MIQVLDSYAIFAYLEQEQGHETVAQALIQALEDDAKLLMTSVNWGEVYYILLREQGQRTADKVLLLLKNLPIQILPADETLCLAAAELKAVKKMSYADCFAAALAKQQKAALLTGDPEFREVENEIQVLWLR